MTPQRVVRIGCVLLMGLATLVPNAPAVAVPPPVVEPAQWIVKQYTEALGRTPTADEWRQASGWFARPGACTAATFRRHGPGLYLGTEFLSVPYTPASRLLAAYRGILNREPDQAGFDARLARLSSGTASWEDMVRELFADREVDELVPRICRTTGVDPASYGFGGTPAPTLPVGPVGFPGGAGEQLQALLLATPPGGTVVLAQRSVTRLTQPLVVPAGVALTTAGAPGTRQYADMGRLVRGTPYTGDAVYVGPGAKLHNVWFDGQLGDPLSGRWSSTAPGLVLQGGPGTELRDSRVSNTNGHRAVYVAGVGLGGAGCVPGAAGLESLVVGNVITAYGGAHYDKPDGGHYVQDGISVACGNTVVSDNTVVDSTDVAVIVFFEPAGQHSKVVGNTVVQAGLSSWAAYSASGEGAGHDVTRTVPLDFSGTRITDNGYWTSSRAHLDIALSVGSRSWFGETTAFGRGAQFLRNQAGLAPDRPARVVEMIGHSGMLDAVVQGNDGWVDIDGSMGFCPPGRVIASVSAGWASGDIQEYDDVELSRCIGHERG